MYSVHGRNNYIDTTRPADGTVATQFVAFWPPGHFAIPAPVVKIAPGLVPRCPCGVGAYDVPHTSCMLLLNHQLWLLHHHLSKNYDFHVLPMAGGKNTVRRIPWHFLKVFVNILEGLSAINCNVIPAVNYLERLPGISDSYSSISK